MRASIGPTCLAVLPLVVWPGLVRPFSDPKIAWMLAAIVCIGVVCARRVARGVADLPWLGAIVAVWVLSFVVAASAARLPSLPVLVIGLAAPVLGVLVAVTSPPSRVMSGQVVGATACAVVALAQWGGADVFAAFGWQAPIDGASVRMRVYGTLGNPNFVGVLMAMSLPLALAIEGRATHRLSRGLRVVAAMLLAAALVATGSRGAVLGIAVAVAVWALLRWTARVRVGLLVVATCAVAAILTSPARPLDTTAEGRFYLWRVVAPRVPAAVVTGHGPGAVALSFPDWQRSAARDGLRDRRFAGLTDHVHNDYLEALVERGLLGLASLVLPLGVVGILASRVPRPVSPMLVGAVASVAAGAACAMVDFPLARPVELTWWWAGVSLVIGEASRLPHARPQV